jgi:exodeoxyribonuclease VII small subunit
MKKSEVNSLARKKESYVELLDKLEVVIDSLESPTLDLDKSIKNYEEGVSLVNKLYKMLNEYEGKVKVINNNIETELEE